MAHAPRTLLPAVRRRLSVAFLLLATAGLSAFSPTNARGQVVPVGGIGGFAPGVWLDADGTVRRREADTRDEMAAMRARAKAAEQAAKNEQLAFVSIPRTLAAAKAARDAGKDVPADLLYLGGLTQIKFLFVYPETNDLVVVGPAEPWVVADKDHAFGKKTGRPVMRLDDLVVAIRTVRNVGPGVFGCALDPDPNSVKAAEQAIADNAGKSRGERMKAMAAAIGPQKVRIFGTPADTRFAFACVAADYELKRYGLGLAQSPVPNIGNGVDNTRSAANKFWFELKFDPILVSPDGLAYGLRGPRLGVKAGGFDFDPRGATEKAVAFAKRMDQNVEALAAAQPLFSDLQNLADLTVVAALIDRDRLAHKVGWDNSWVYDDNAFTVAKLPTPKTAATLVNYTNGAIASGGVVLSPARALQEAKTEKDEKGLLATPREQGAKLRQAAAGGAAVVGAQVVAESTELGKPGGPTTKPAARPVGGTPARP
jgi:hypothetical protein